MSKGEAMRGAQLSGTLAATILTSGTDFDFGSSNEVEGRFEQEERDRRYISYSSASYRLSLAPSA